MTSETPSAAEQRALDGGAAAAMQERHARRRLEDEFTAERHVYEPHRVGLPPLGSYLRTLWQRREFAWEYARTELRTQHFDTVFGQLWLILNPLMFAGVYFVLVDILRHHHRPPGFFAHLIAGLFAYQLVSGAMRQGVRSVVAGGKLILNTAFPRVLLPISSVITAFMRFLPTIGIYAVVHALSGLPLRWGMLWVIPIMVLLLVMATGFTVFVAAAQVYFRDLNNLLGHVLRLWLYVSPVLYYAHDVPARYHILLLANPIAPLLTAWNDVLTGDGSPTPQSLEVGGAWAIVIFILGCLFFISREREFAVRL